MLSDLEEAISRSKAPSGLSRRGGSLRVDPYAMAAENGATSYLYGPHANERELALEQYQYYNSHVYSAIQIIARRISAQPLLVARVGKPRDKRRSLKAYLDDGFSKYQDLPQHVKTVAPEDLELLPSHPIIDTLQSPNELMTRSSMLNDTIASWCVTGRSFWIITDNPEGRFDFVCVPTTWIESDHEKQDDKLIAKWLLCPFGSSTQDQVSIPNSRVVQFFFPDPSDPFGAISPLQAQSRSVLSDEAISITQYKIFKNSINPGHAVFVGEAATGDGKRQMKLEPYQRRQLMTWLRQEFAGAERFGSPIILDAIIRDLKPLMNKPIEMSFRESASFVKTRLYEGFGVNPISAGQVEGSNRASSGVADHHLVSNTINPMLNMMGEILTVKALPVFNRNGENLKAWFAPCEAYDPDLTLKKFDLGMKYGAVTRNELRVQVFGLPAREGMDDVSVSNRVVNTPAGERMEPDAPPPEEFPEPDNDNIASHRLSFQKAGDVKRSDDRTKDVLNLRTKDGTVARWLKTHGEAERSMVKPLAKFIHDQVESAASKLASIPGPISAEEILHSDAWTDTLKSMIRPHLLEQGYAGAVLQYVEHKQAKSGPFDFSLPPHVDTAINNAIDDILGYGYWNDISETTLKDIAKQLRDGLDANETTAQLANRIRDSLGVEYYSNRASFIARTESTASLNCGQNAALDQLAEDGIVDKKEWLNIVDDDTRPAHLAMEGEKAIVPVNEPFDVGGYPAMYPGDPQLPASQRTNCRCSLAGVLADAYNGKSHGMSVCPVHPRGSNGSAH